MRVLQLTFTVIVFLITACGKTNNNNKEVISSPPQTFTISADGVKHTLSDTTVSYVLMANFGQGSGIFSLSAMSERQNFQFGIKVAPAKLEAGSTYAVYDPGFASSSNPNNYKTPNNKALYGPYPGAAPDVSSFLSAYSNDQLNLHPAQLTISSVTDEQLAGNLYKTKRIKGSFSGILAYTESDGVNWVVKKTKSIEVTFDVYCSLLP